MYQIQISVEEIKPGVLAFKAKPTTDQNTTDLEQQAGDLLNQHVANFLKAAMGDHATSGELMEGPSGEVTDAIHEARKEEWRENEPPPQDGTNPTRN